MSELGSATRGAAVRLEGVSKRFGATQALNDVSIEVEAGKIHALVGENGAGKSTVGKIVGGLYVADSGQLYVDDQPVNRWDPPSALAAGIATIQQELSLVPGRTVAENVFLGIERSSFGVLRGSQRKRYLELEDAAGFGIDPDVIVGSLRLADQQKVEVMRALARNARLLVMDEPTSSLTKDEADRLHQLMDRLRAEGRTIIYVSHFLDEVLEWADTITIMRDGIVTRTAPATDETKDTLIEGMLGRSFDAAFPPIPEVPSEAPVVLEVEAVSGDYPKDISFSIRAGEIIGLAGLVGSGRTELARVLFGVDAMEGGTVRLDGVDVAPLTPRKAINLGLVMLPEDRRSLGLVMTQNVRENVTLPRLGKFARRGRVSLKNERTAVSSMIEQLNIVPPDVDGELQYYSGGNQQKSLFAKWTLEQPRLIILDEPTRGVDVGAKRAIYDAIVSVAAKGSAVLLISSELEEVLWLSHRVLLMSGGRIIAESDAADLTIDEALRILFESGKALAQ